MIKHLLHNLLGLLEKANTMHFILIFLPFQAGFDCMFFFQTVLILISMLMFVV